MKFRSTRNLVILCLSLLFSDSSAHVLGQSRVLETSNLPNQNANQNSRTQSSARSVRTRKNRRKHRAKKVSRSLSNR